MKFTTKDQDNDTWNKNCGVNFQGGWWVKDCHYAFLNGPYQKPAKIAWNSIMWYGFGNENRALKKATMMIRSKI